jgi:aspartate kinase
MKVFKFGGTSVGSAANMRRVAEIVTGRGAAVTVLSAMSGTTDALVEICNVARRGGGGERGKEIAEGLRAKYAACIDDLLKDGREAAHALLDAAVERVVEQAVWFRDGVSDRVIVAQGELVTSAIFAAYMRERGHETVLLNAPDFVRKDAEGMAAVALEGVREGVYYVTQGFVCSDAAGNLDNLGRGGSDYSAALIGAAIGADEVQIWTDIDGMHNNDPRYVEGTFPIRRMNFDEAAELAYFGAKILHPATIVPCRERGISVALKNTMNPDAEGTLITDEEAEGKGVRAIAAKDGITVIRIHSAGMLMAYGFLRRVFEVFERHRTPIDMITTSEVAVSLTVDDDSHLHAIEAELAELGSIEAEGGNTIVCVVGDLGHDANGVAADILEGVETIPIKMISYGASHRSMAMLVDSRYKREFLQRLNDHLFAAHA